jgi:hypothetical protein
MVLHGAGQSPEAFKEYFEAMGDDQKPALYMSYVALKDEMSSYFHWLTDQLDSYRPYNLIPQIGLHLAGDARDEQSAPHYEQEIAGGQLDEQIQAFCDGLQLLQRPVYVRIGFEFNGPWNGYEPETYRAAWRRIVSAVRAAGLEQVAAVWCYYPLPSSREHPQGRDRDYLAFYPGDDYVDWWSIDLFSAEDFQLDNTQAFMHDAQQHKYPVMIGESTPRRVGGVQAGDVTWHKWFVPYFSFIHTWPTVKAFCYISWNWAEYPVWADWGDARIGINQKILTQYRQELTDLVYQHAPVMQ